MGEGRFDKGKRRDGIDLQDTAQKGGIRGLYIGRYDPGGVVDKGVDPAEDPEGLVYQVLRGVRPAQVFYMQKGRVFSQFAQHFFSPALFKPIDYYACPFLPASLRTR